MGYEVRNILPRNNYLIDNEYYITNSHKDDYHLVIYYVTNSKIKIVLRKMNNDNGWNYDIVIKLYDSFKNHEISLLFVSDVISWRTSQKYNMRKDRSFETNKETHIIVSMSLSVAIPCPVQMASAPTTSSRGSAPK